MKHFFSSPLELLCLLMEQYEGIYLTEVGEMVKNLSRVWIKYNEKLVIFLVLIHLFTFDSLNGL